MQLFLLTVEETGLGKLNAIETRHCTRVLRHQAGDMIHAIDGAGNMYHARIQQIHKNHTDLELVERHANWGEHGHSLRLAVSPLRLKDRFEWLIEKAVELGVTEIIPLHCAHTDTHKTKFKPERLQTLMLTALKQCKRSRLPILHPIQSIQTWLDTESSGEKFIAWCKASTHLTMQADQIKSAQNLTLMIGPEGDFSEEEVALAQSKGFSPILLGEQRLRSETASLFALSLIKGWWGY